MKTQILFRKFLSSEEEIKAARKHFPVKEYRTKVLPNNLIIPRYAVLPYYKELERDINNLGSQLINSYEQHKWIANFEWYNELKNYTFESWNFEEFLTSAPEGEYIAKGKTNSKKFLWNRMMYGKNKKEAYRIGLDLNEDSLISTQGVIFRKFEKLNVIETGINEMPFAEEFRFFFLREDLIDYGYYWSIIDQEPPKIKQDLIDFSKEVGKIVAQRVNFFVLDVARKDNGDPVLVEINDGSMSGLSMIDPDNFYRSLKKIRSKHE